ncbi:MAG: threonine/serine exporter family protein [Gemmiger sp.]|nr:threonine/serine exporter family protein [Gemmiger sp.]
MKEEQTAKSPPQQVMALVMEAGSTLLENGGEVLRVQQTMQIMAQSLGLPDFHVYVLTSGIFASAQGSVSEVRHMPYITVNLGRVEAVNELSREVAAGALTLQEASARLQEIRAMPPYSRLTEVVAAAVGAGSFAYLFGAHTPAPMLVAAVAGAAELLLTRWLQKLHINRIFSDMAAAAIAMAIVLGCGALLPGLNANSAVIGALMVLTPGVALVMGIRDFINADYLSGTIRLISAVLVAGSLAFGVGFAYTLARQLWGVAL